MLPNHFLIAAGGSGHTLPLFWWQGFSGHWYVTSLFDLNRFECTEAGAFVLVRREADGTRTPLMLGSAPDISEALYETQADALLRAIKAGANEIHVHLAAHRLRHFHTIAIDLAAGWGIATANVLAPA